MIRIFLAALALVSLAACARAQQPGTVNIQRDIIYASPGNTPQKLDVYVPAGLPAPPPVVIYIHGGGWQAGDKNNPMLLPLTKLGLAMVSINYRLSQVAIWPAQIFDCKAAVRWVRANASSYGYNADKIGLIGDSAGGHLVALLGTSAGDPKLEGDEGNAGVSSAVQAVVDFYGPTDFLTITEQANLGQRMGLDNPVTHLFGGPIWDNGPVADKQAAARSASPVFHVSAQSCPFFIAHGDHDTIVPLQQSIELDDALKKAGVPATLTVVRGGGHGFNDPPTFLAAISFLRQQLGVK